MLLRKIGFCFFSLLLFIEVSGKDTCHSNNELNKFNEWLEQNTNDNDRKSYVSILTVNKNAHYSAILSALKCSKVYHYRNKANFYTIDTMQQISGGTVGLIKQLLLKKATSAYSVFFIENSDSLEVFEFEEIVNIFYRKTILSLTKDINIQNIAVLLSTSIGNEMILQLDTVDRYYSAIELENVVFKQVRRRFFSSSSVIFHNYRRLVEIVQGNINENLVNILIKTQTKERENKQNSHIYKTGIEFIENSGFIGQKNVIKSIKQALISVENGLKMSNGPQVYLFAGIAGTGKTFLSQLIAIAYSYDFLKDSNKITSSVSEMLTFLKQNNLFLHVDMGNYQDDRAIDGFIDPSPGLQGEGLLSKLYEKAKDEDKDRIIVVLDEVEKAHPDLLQSLLHPVIDSNNGHIQKKKTGETYKTSNSIFILTTNCFDNKILELQEEGLKYQNIVTKIGELFIDTKAKCLSAKHQKNPFASVSLWRRILSGQALATRDKFLAFLPPTKEDEAKLIINSLESIHKKFNKSKNNKLKGLYYTNKALKKLQYSSGNKNKNKNMGEVESYVETTITDLILKKNLNKICFAILFVDINSNLDLQLYFPTSIEINQKQTKTYSTEVDIEESKSISIELETVTTSDGDEVDVNTKYDESNELDLEVDTLEDKLEVEDISILEDEKVIILTEEEVDYDNLYSIAIAILVASLIAYFFLLPLLKSVLLLTALVISVLYLFFPEFTKKMLKAIATAGKVLYNFISSGYFYPFLLFILFVYIVSICWKLKEKVENGTVSFSDVKEIFHIKYKILCKKELKSNRRDIIRRWCLLSLRLQTYEKKQKLKENNNIKQTLLALNDDKFNRNFIINNKRRILRSNSTPDRFKNRIKKKFSIFKTNKPI